MNLNNKTADLTQRFQSICSRVVLVVIFFSGCLKMGPDYQKPDIGLAIPESFQHEQTVSEKPQLNDKWWQVFGDPELDQLVEKVIKNNLDIQMATHRILEIRSQFIKSRADRFPAFTLQGQGARQKQAQYSMMPHRMTQYTLSLPASFELDLWGLFARLSEAARADLLKTEQMRHTVTQGVVAETIALYLQIESFERQLEIVKKNITSLEHSLRLVESRYKRGLAIILELRQARRSLARARAALPNLRQSLNLAQQKLNVLCGQYPRSASARSQPDDYFKHLAPVPAGLPANLLRRRPDIQAAEAKLQTLNAMVGAAKAGRFPHIRLTARFGYSSDELSRLFTPQNELWDIAMDLSQPLFDAGKLKADQRKAEARYKQGVADYIKTVLTAFSEVEGALVTRQEQLERRELVLDFLTESRATQQIAESRYERGLVDYLTVLESQQTRFQAEQDLALVELAILTNRVTLHRVLGGGWAQGQKTIKNEKFLKIIKN